MLAQRVPRCIRPFDAGLPASGPSYGWRLSKSLAPGLVRPEPSAVGTGLENEIEIEIPGERHAAMVIPESPFDPENERLGAQAVRGQPWTAAFGPPSGISGNAGRAGSIWSQDGARLV